MSNNPYENIVPNIVSKNLESHAYYIAGLPKTGKTTLASMFPRCVVFLLERGGDCIPGLIGLDIKNWEDLDSKVEFLNTDLTRSKFSMVAIDTLDKLIQFAFDKIVRKYNSMEQSKSTNAGSGSVLAEDMGDVGLYMGTQGNHWNKAYALVEKILVKIFKTYRYGLLIIGHTVEKTVKVKKGREVQEYTTIDYGINSKCLKIVNELVDVSCIVKNEIVRDSTTGKEKIYPMCYFRSDGAISSGNRFKYLTKKVPFNYKSFTNAILEAIEKQEKEAGVSLYTEEKNTGTYSSIGVDTFEEIKKLVNCQLSTLSKKYKNDQFRDFDSFWRPLISEIINKNTNGKKLNDLTEENVEEIKKIRAEIQELTEQYSD